MLTYKLKKRISLNGISEKDGIPHIWDVPCVRDNGFGNIALKPGLTYTNWICPCCLNNLNIDENGMYCKTGCHLANEKLTSVFLKKRKRSFPLTDFLSSLFQPVADKINSKRWRRPMASKGHGYKKILQNSFTTSFAN